MSRRLVLLAALAATAPAPALAQRTLASAGEDVKHVFGDALHVATAPFRTDADDLSALLGVAAGFGLMTLGDADVQRWIREHPGSAVVRAFEPWGEGHLAWVGDTRHLLGLSGALYALGFAGDSRSLRDAALGCITADGTGSLIRHGVYGLVSRERPYSKTTGEHVREADHWAVPGGDWDHHSFFGGHAANIMSCVSFWNHRFDLGLAEPLLYGFAAALGVERTIQERHWTSDTLLGILFGYAVGAEIARQYARREREAGAGSGIAPQTGLMDGPQGRTAVYIGLSFRFQE